MEQYSDFLDHYMGSYIGHLLRGGGAGGAGGHLPAGHAADFSDITTKRAFPENGNALFVRKRPDRKPGSVLNGNLSWPCVAARLTPPPGRAGSAYAPYGCCFW